MNLRTIVLHDYEKLTQFWKENYFVSDMDNEPHFKLFLEKNPELSVLIEKNGEIIGSALGSYDGRRGYLQKVVVKKDMRKGGIGKDLVDEIIKRLKHAGGVFVPISVEPELVPFYEKCGFIKKDAVSMTLDLK